MAMGKSSLKKIETELKAEGFALRWWIRDGWYDGRSGRECCDWWD